MQRLSLAAKLYISVVVAASLAAFIYTYHSEGSSVDWPLLVGLCVVNIFAQFWQVRLFYKPNAGENNSKMSLGFVPTFFTLLAFGPFPAMVTSAVGYTVSALYLRRSFVYQMAFSVAAISLSTLAAGLILRQVGLATGKPTSEGAVDILHWDMLLQQLLSIFISTLVYYLVNTGSIATAIALCTDKNPLHVWRGNFLWTGPGYFAGASCATILFAFGLGDKLRSAEQWGLLIVFAAIAAPILGVIYWSYKIYMEKLHAHEQHILELQRGKQELQHLYTSTVESLALAIDAKDRYTKEHILRVQSLAVTLAKELGLSGDDLQAIETGALLHDIGKLGIPEHILAKPGKLSEDEYEKIKAHPVIGSVILEPVRFPWPVLPAVRSHHERWDGRGYPDGLKAEEIPLSARIMAVADVYDALTSDRSYREGWPPEKARRHIRDNAGTHFDPQVVEVFLRITEPAANARTSTALPLAPSAAETVSARRDEVAEGINRTSLESLSLYEISQTVSVSLSLQETLSLMAGKINTIFGGATCVVLLAEGELLRAEMAVGKNEAFFYRAETRIGEGMTGRVAQGGQGTAGDYDRGDLVLSSSDKPWSPLQSALITPLIDEGKVIGTINVYCEEAAAFRTEDVRVLQAIADQASRAISNALMFEKTRESALTDALTGLRNARYLAVFLEQELQLAAREQRPLSLLVMDLDNFKPINDAFGHIRGNQVLRDLGEILPALLRSGDMVARYAGDEFVVVLPNTEGSEAKVVAEKIRAAVAAYDPRLSGSEIGTMQVGISIGTASYPEEARDAATLIACADAAMYRDKSARKGHQPASATAEDTSPPTELRLVA